MKKFIIFVISIICIIQVNPSMARASVANESNAVVKIYVLDKNVKTSEDFEEANVIGYGSGAIINHDLNEIVTTYGTIQSYLEDSIDKSLMICLNVDEKNPPSCQMMAKVLKYNMHLNLAHLEISKAYNDSSELFESWQTMKMRYYLSGIGTVNYKVDGRLTENLELGEHLSVMGFPYHGGSTLTISNGVVSGFYLIDIEDDDKYVLFIKTDAAINPGMWGGPVLDENNLFVGIAAFSVGGDGNIGYVIPYRTIVNFLLDKDEAVTVTLEKIQQEYENWAKSQCGDNSRMDTEGFCVCEEGYEWENDNPQNYQCVESESEDEQLLERKEYFDLNTEDSGDLEDETQDAEGRPIGDDSSGDIPLESEENEMVFSDVPHGHTNFDAIKYLKEQGIIHGYEDGTFKPTNAVNRAELLKILIESAEEIDSFAFDKNCFTDVISGEWYTAYVCYAKERNWVNGYTDGSFRPGQTVTKAEAVKIILTAFAIEIPHTAQNTNFDDVSLEDWFAPYIQIASEKDFLEEISGFYNPHTGMTRASTSEMIYRVLMHLQK